MSGPNLTRRALGAGSATVIAAAAFAPARAEPSQSAVPGVGFHEFLSATEIAGVSERGNRTDLSAAFARARDHCARTSPTPTLLFPPGEYAYSRAQDWGFANARIEGSGHVVLRYLGTGDAFPVTDRDVTGLFGLHFAGLTIEAPPGSRHGIYLNSVHHSTLRDMHVRGCGGAALRIDFAVCTLVEHFVCSHNRQGGGRQGFANAARPRVGIALGRGGVSKEPASYCTFINPIVEGTTIGGLLESSGAIGCSIIGGTLEGCGERGLVIMDGCRNNRVQFTDFEENGIEDILNRGTITELLSVDCLGGTTYAAPALGGRISGGQHNRITLGPGTRGIVVDAVAWNVGGKGRLENAGENRMRDMLDVSRQRLTDGAQDGMD